MASAFSKFTSGLTGHGQGHQDGNNHEHKEESLSTILSTHEDRASLLLLIASCTDVMRAQAVDTFDPEKTGQPKEKTLKFESSSSGEKRQDDEDDQSQKSPDVAADGEEKQKAEDRAKKDYDVRAKELSSPQMKELKEAALDAFDTWRDKVIARVGEVVNEHKEVENAAQEGQASAESSTQQEWTGPSPSKTSTRDATIQSIYPPLSTSLASLDEPKRVLILHSLLLLLLSLETYNAYSRTLLLHITTSLRLSNSLFTQDEAKVAQGLLASAAQQMNADDETKAKIDSSATARKWKVGLGAAAGAVLIGVTGGLAAPLLAAGVGTVMGGIGLGATATAGYLGALAGSAPLVGALFGAYGGRMTGNMVDAYAREVEDFAFVPVHGQHRFFSGKDEKSSHRLRVIIAISGYLTEKAEVTAPWRSLSPENAEPFALRFELSALIALGNALTTYIKSAAWGWAKKQIISRTIFASLSAALTLPYGMAKAARVVDNPYSVAKSRSEKAGIVLADALVKKVQGERPVVLVGYSLGARVIQYCLEELSRRKAFGLVESVVLMGGAVPSDSIVWRRMRSVVAGRVINAYSKNDYLLGFLYRTSSLQYGIAGLSPIEDVAHVENVDVSDVVEGHTMYRFVTGRILQTVAVEELDDEEVTAQEKRMHIEEQKEQEEREKNEREHKDDGEDGEKEAKKMEKEVEEKNIFSQGVDYMKDTMGKMKISGGSTATTGTVTGAAVPGPTV